MPLTSEQFAKITTKDEFNELKTEIGEINVNVKKILTAVDGLTKKHEDFATEMTANQGVHDRLDKKMNDHEGRIKQLELKTALS